MDLSEGTPAKIVSCQPYPNVVNTTHCSNKPNEVCDYICLDGYKKNPNVHSLYCDRYGKWSVSKDMLCEGPFRIHWFSALIGTGPGVFLALIFLSIALVLCRKFRKKKELYFIEKLSLTNSQKHRRGREVGYTDPELAVITNNQSIEEQTSLLSTEKINPKKGAIPDMQYIEMNSETNRLNRRHALRMSRRKPTRDPEISSTDEDYDVIDDIPDEYPGQRQCRTLSCSRVLVHREYKPSLRKHKSVSDNVTLTSYMNQRGFDHPLLKRQETAKENFYSNDQIHRHLEAEKRCNPSRSPDVIDDYQDARSALLEGTLTSSSKSYRDIDSSDDSEEGEDYQNVPDMPDYLNLKLKG